MRGALRDLDLPERLARGWLAQGWITVVRRTRRARPRDDRRGLPVKDTDVIDPGSAPWPRARLLALVAVLSVAAALRLRHVTWGLPDFPSPDELNHFVELAERAEGSNFRDIRPVSYIYPPGYALSLALVLRGARSMRVLDCGEGLTGLTGDACAVLVGRLWTAMLGTLTVALVYLASRGWQTLLGRLLSAAALAVAPFHVLSSRLANPDVAMTFWMLVSLTCSIRAAGHLGWLTGAAFFAGFAAATKYPGIF